MNKAAKNDIANVPLFAEVDIDDLLKSLADCEIKNFRVGDFICREGEYDENCSILLSGRANVELRQEGAKSLKKIELKEGEIFGEIAVLSGNPRTANIRTSNPCRVLSISRNNLFKLLDKFPLIHSRVGELYRERALRSRLHTIPIFSGISEDLLESLVNKVTLHSCNKGEPIFHQGDEADAFYLIRYGFVKVSATKDGKEKVMSYLKDGHYFGEIALLKEGEKRTATVTAINRVELIKISRDDFQELIKTYPRIKSSLEKIMKKRKERNYQVSKNALLEKTISSAIDSGVIQTKAVLIMDQTKCVQCDNCVHACSALHNNHSRLVRKGAKFNNFLLIPTSCRHCDDPTCMSNCPTGAITRGADGEVFHKDFCVGCGNCAKGCPYGNISVVDIYEKNESKVSNLFGLFSGFFKSRKNGKSNGASLKTSKADRFIFPGDRDMVQRTASEKLKGDRDIIENFASDAEASNGKNKKSGRKAVKCDMCRDYSFMGCVYNCPVGAARRVDPSEFFSEMIAVG